MNFDWLSNPVVPVAGLIASVITITQVAMLGIRRIRREGAASVTGSDAIFPAEQLHGTTGWVERVKTDHREWISPDGRRYIAPITPSGELDPDFAAILRSQPQFGSTSSH